MHYSRLTKQNVAFVFTKLGVTETKMAQIINYKSS